ncbi:MAG: AMP-binding protein [Mangrovicoccus sp.]|nr:AMP-binding protein [Mangrovicoccus sp.]
MDLFDISRTAQKRPDDLALLDRAGGLTWRALADALTDTKTQLGSTRRLIAIEARPSLATLTAYLGALSAGHAIAMLPLDDERAWESFDRDFTPDAIFRDPSGWEILGPPIGEGLHPDLALLLSTSGSTGESKFVRLSYENLRSNAAAISEYQNLTPKDRAALILPLQYCYGLSVLHSHLIKGASLYLVPGSVMDPGFVEDIGQQGCTSISGVPHSYRLFDQIGFRGQMPESLRFMTVAGGRLPADRARLYGAHLAARGGQLFVMYGQTEATARIAFVPPEALPGHEATIGQAIPGGALSLEDDQGRAVTGPGQSGELVYRGPNVMMGYASGRADLAREAEIDVLRTGDLAERLENGFYRIIGRLKRISKISGLRISHDALEEALARAGVEAAITGDDQGLYAAYCSPLAPEDLRHRLAEASGLPELVLHVMRVPALPRLAAGKPDYPAVKALFEAQTPQADLLEIYREAFAPKQVRESDSFVSLGGDSLRFVQMSLSLEQAFEHLPEHWERRSIGELSQLASDRASERAGGAASPAPTRPMAWARLAPISTDMVLRVLAIGLVVVHHATHWPIPGGAAAMMVMVGFGLARFQGAAALDGAVGRLFSGLPRVLAPYFLILAGFAIGWGQIPWASVFLIGNVGFADPVDHNMLPYLYWFVEIFAQSVAIMGLFLALPQGRALARGQPFIFSLLLIGFGLALRFAWAEHWDFGGRQIFTIPWNFYLFAFGWAAAMMRDTRERLVIFALACAVMPAAAYWGGNWTGAWVKYLLQLPVIGALLFLPRIYLPKALILPVIGFAAAGYHIYLFHRLVPDNLPGLLGRGISEDLYVGLSIVVGVLCGLLAYWLQNRLLGWGMGVKLSVARRPMVLRNG